MRKNSVEFKCERCGEIFRRPKSRLERANRFCSKECMVLWGKDHPDERRRLPKLVCLACGKEVVRKHFSRQIKFCSSLCYHEYQSRLRREADPNCKRCEKPLSSPHTTKSGLCLDCWRKHASEDGLCFKPKLLGWSFKYEKCVRCGDTSSEHHGNGICHRCWAKEGRRRKKGTWEKTCEVCGEGRSVSACHIVPRRLGGPEEGWNTLYLCATHHHCFDEDEMTDSEWSKVEGKAREAFNRFPVKGARFGRRGLPWTLRKIVPLYISEEMRIQDQINV